MISNAQTRASFVGLLAIVALALAGIGTGVVVVLTIALVVYTIRAG